MTPAARTRPLVAAGVVMALVAGCASASPEQQAIMNYFRAVSLRDTTVVDNIAVVPADQRTGDIVETFTIRRIGPENQRHLSGSATEAVTRLVVRSLTPPGQPDAEVSTAGLEIISKQVVLDANVRQRGGRAVRGTLAVTLERAIRRNGSSESAGRWIVTAVTPLRASRTSREASSAPPS